MRCMTEQCDLFSDNDDERGVADVCVSGRMLVLSLNWQMTKEIQKYSPYVSDTHIGSFLVRSPTCTAMLVD